MNFNLFEKNWTTSYSQKKIVNISDKIVNKCISKIYTEKIDIFNNYDFSREEIDLLLRWPIYVATNTFLDRLMNVSINKNSFFYYLTKKNEVKIFKTTIEASTNYYNNFNFNYILIKDLYKIIYLNKFKFHKNKEFIVNDLDYKFKKIKISFYSRIYSFFYKIYSRLMIKIVQKLYKLPIFYEGDKWFETIFPAYYRFPEHRIDKKTKRSEEYRNKLKKCFKETLKEEIHQFNFKFNKKTYQKISLLFANWAEKSISSSLVEDLGKKINFYIKVLNRNKIKEIHSSTGYYFNDNLKIFSILARRRKAMLFAQDDGVDNYLNYFPINKAPYQFKGLNQLRMVDFYCAWGIGKIYDGYNKVQRKFNTKIINTGSVYLKNLSKSIQDREIKIDKFTIFYPSGPIRMFRASLEEMSPQRNFIHRIKILYFLKSMLNKYPGMQLIYKCFIGTDLKHDPITDILKNEISSGRLKIYFDPPIKLMPEVDIMFFDMISTGFAEAININTPAIVFGNKDMKNTISKKGLKVNKLLEKSHCLFYNKFQAEKSFEFVLKNTKKFNLMTKKPKQMFLQDLAFPVNEKQFIRNYKINAKY